MPFDKIPPDKRIGLIAGSGRFPIIFAQEARKHGCSLITIAIKGDASSSLKGISDIFYSLDVVNFLELFTRLRKEGITKCLMAGQINPMNLFKDNIRRSPELVRFLSDLKDKRADTIFGAIAKRLNDEGIELIDSTMYLEDYLPQEGVLTKRKPTQNELEDIQFGFKIAKKLGEADVGQTVCIKDKIVVGVEAIEGTDATILRSGRIAKKGLVVIKTSKPNQDMRFDIPLIGPRTIKNLARINAAVLAIEAKKTLVLDKNECVSLADRNNIAILSLKY